jgi:hypothetical protein
VALNINRYERKMSGGKSLKVYLMTGPATPQMMETMRRRM